MDKLKEFQEKLNDLEQFTKGVEKIKRNRDTTTCGCICDKHTEGFVKYPSAFGSIKLEIGGFESLSGHFGSSDVFTDITGSDYISECMTKAINELTDTILQKTIRIMKEDLIKSRDEAVNEYDRFILKCKKMNIEDEF